jgi:hypothetical protein
MIKKKEESLLEKINLEEIHDIILTEELKKSGYRIHYFIDPTDIIRYCFPLGLIKGQNVDKREEKALEYISDEQITYQLFFKTIVSKVFILDEYFIEYTNFKGIIDFARNFGLKIYDSLEEQIERFEYEDNLDMIATVNDNNLSELHVSLLLSILIGSISNGVKLVNELDKNILRFIGEGDFKECQDFFEKELSKIYSKCLKYKYLESFNSSFNSLPRLESKQNDFKALDIIIQMNKLDAEKNLFLFVCSDDTIQRLRKSIRNKNILPKIGQHEFEPIRTTSQLFFYLLCYDPQSNIDENIACLRELEDAFIYKERNKGINSTSLETVELNEKFNKRLKQLREKLENISLISKYPIYKSYIDKMYENDKLKSHEGILKGLTKIKELSGNDYISDTRNATLNDIRYEHSFSSVILTGLNSIKNNDENFVKRAGKDNVTSFFHQFPIVFNFRSAYYKELNCKIVEFLIDYNVKHASTENTKASKDSGKAVVNDFINFITSTVTSLYVSHESDKYENKLLRILIFLILPYQGDNNNPEKKAYEIIKEMLDDEILQNNRFLLSEYLYVASWIARRINDSNFSEAEKFSNEGIEINANDPRFYHSLCLIRYNQFRTTKNPLLLEDQLKNCNKAIKLYSEILDNRREIEKSINVLLNSKAYTLALMHKYLRKDQSFLIEARTSINSLKLRESNYHFLPEFLHTEALLEFEEYFYSKDLNKLQYANEAIEKALMFRQNDEYYFELKKEIEKEFKRNISISSLL